MRLFIAIDLPESQRQLVASLAPDGLKGAKAVPMHQLHLTLRFLGEVSEPRVPELSAALRDISFPPFSLRLQSIGTFPNSKRPRVLWLGIEEIPALLDLQGRIEAAVQSVGLAPEVRPFAPHFTLARFKFGGGRELEDYLNRYREFSGEAWQAEEFLLYSSVLGQKGAIHEILQRYPALPSAPIICETMVMKSFRKELWFNIPTRRAFVNITPQVASALRESGIHEGMILVNAMHISASVFVNDDESGLHHDFEVFLERLAPHEPIDQYRHNDTGEDNADAHIKRQIFGREVVVAVTDGKLDFGTWEQIFYGEFDGRRKKRVLVKIIGE